jgi:hypothetical protein
MPHTHRKTETVNAQQFRKKPVVIEARQWDGTAEGATPIIDWIIMNGPRSARYRERRVEALTPYRADDINQIVHPAHIAIDTLEGTMHASVGDWIIRGVQGEFYPCKPDIFAATYETVA